MHCPHSGTHLSSANFKTDRIANRSKMEFTKMRDCHYIHMFIFFSVFFFWPLLALTCGQGMEWHKEWKGKKIPITESAAYINLITQRWWRSRGNGENKMPHASTEFDIQTQFKIFAYFMRFLGGTGNPIPKKVYKKKMLKYANVIVCHGEVAWLRGCSRNVDWMNSTINESASTADA